MNTRPLNALQVAALLVSASYGIGFLFGTGEMAIEHGMGASTYGLATALGMLMLARLAPPLWRAGVPVWDLFGRAHGAGLKNAIALLSLIWMGGVLAAQIHGGLAIARLAGAPGVVAYAAVLGAIFAMSKLDLRAASTVFGWTLVASGLVLIYALVSEDGARIYVETPVRYAADIRTFSVAAYSSIVVAVVALVCAGADYHQFVLAARRPSSAAWGCVLAAICLAIISPLPAAVVMALRESSILDAAADGRQVIPFALSRAASRIHPGFESVLLLGLSAAALGSGAAILRAMASALSAASSGVAGALSARPTAVSLLLGTVLAGRGQGIIDTMVSVNVIYIASVGIALIVLLAGWHHSTRRAAVSIGAGFAASFGVYLAHWLGVLDGDGDSLSLLAGLAAAGLVFVDQWVRSMMPKSRLP